MTSSDEASFAAQVERHRAALQLHCYRMLGSFDESEDMVQETLLRAWRGRATYEGRASLRSWLYRIATNACLDFLRARPERVARTPDVPWLQPYPDHLLEQPAPEDADPETAAVANETVELVFLVAIQHLPPLQRAALLLRDVLGWSAKQTAGLLDTSVAAANSALQRARATMQEQLPPVREAWSAQSAPSHEERLLLERYVDAHRRADSAAVIAMLHEQVRFTMPPEPTRYEGQAAVASFFADAFGPERPGDFRLVPTRANRQPAAANYLRRPGDATYRALSLDVLRFEAGRLAEITTFGPELFPAFNLPATL